MMGERGSIGAGMLVALTSIGVAGAAVGIGVGIAAGDDDRPSGAVVVGDRASVDAVPIAGCPDGHPIGMLHRGDRVLVTARDGSGDWLEVRDPRDLDERVWVAASVIEPDGELDGLPEHDCPDPEAILGATTSTSSTTGPGAITTTSSTTAPPATSTPTTSAPTTGPPTTGTTEPPDTTAPSITQLTKNRNQIYEDTGVCDPQPHTVVVGATVTDAGGVASAVLRYSFPGTSGTVNGEVGTTKTGNHYEGTIGPFGDVLPIDAVETMTVTMRATDDAGNVATKSLTVQFIDCTLI